MTRAFKTPYNADHFPKDHQVFTQPSQTIPDETMTIDQIVRRFTKGLPLEGKQAVYLGEDEIPDIKRMDLTEIDEYKQMLAEDIKHTANELKKQDAIKDNYRRKKQQEEKQKTSKPPQQITDVEEVE